jgi:uncharacterized protein YbbC (DUF1343 family)
MPPRSRPLTLGALLVLFLACSGSADGSGRARASAPAPRSPAPSRGATPTVLPGIDVLLSDSVHLVRGKRVGLITNTTGVWVGPPGRTAGTPRDLASTIDALFRSPDVKLVALFGPEHGIREQAEAGAGIDSGLDPKTGLPVYSLYGKTLRPTRSMLKGIDVLLFDMQDVGARYYTYMSTMAYAMEAAGAAGIPFVVLDRPDPIRGDVVQGNVLDSAFSTFVGLYPIPMRPGMTLGELARLFVGEFGIHVELHVVPMRGWRRDMTFDQTGLPWIPPSPNMPSLESALAYPGTCLFEGTPLSVGRGTERPFQWVGAPWLDGRALADTLNGYHLPGVRFEAATFTPRHPGDGKFPDTEVHGVRLVAASTDYDAPRAAVAMLVEAYRMSGGHWSWNVQDFDRLAGTDRLRLGIEAGESMKQLTAPWGAEDAAFRKLRRPYLIYR